MSLIAETPDPTLTLLNLGVAGCFIVAAFRGLVWLKPSVDRLMRDLEELRTENKQLNLFLRESIVPAITESNALMRASTEAVTDASELIKVMTRELKRRSP